MTRDGKIIAYIKSLYPRHDPVSLHRPEFLGNEKKYLSECIDTTYVSYVGRFVADLENKIMNITGAKYAVAMVNGTTALHMLLLAVGLQPGDEVITQSLSFVATAATIRHALGVPVFVDVDRDTMGMSPDSLEEFFSKNVEKQGDVCINRITGKRIKAAIPMHTFGHPAKIEAIKEICEAYSILLIEDAAESLGSFYKGKHTGTFGKAAALSFNGNKTVTTGGGGMVITDDEEIAVRVRHISTTAKCPHTWEFYHDEVGYNFRMPSLNAAVGLAQLEYFDWILSNKRETAGLYQRFFHNLDIPCFTEPMYAKSNYWLNAILFQDRKQRDEFLAYSNGNGVQTRPVWNLLHTLPPYQTCFHTDTPNAQFFEDTLVNIPSGVRI
jgi:aminotransferase in exopolysaccharide biosynthesis